MRSLALIALNERIGVRAITRMVSLCALLCAGMYAGPSAASAVDCDGTQHTRMEISICAEPVLHELDKVLDSAVWRASGSAKIFRSNKLRNDVARHCRRQTGNSLSNCLLHTETHALKSVLRSLGEIENSQAPHADVGQYEGMSDIGDDRLAALNSLLILTGVMPAGEDKDRLKAYALAALVTTFESQTQDEVQTGKTISLLSSSVIDGCSAEGSEALWESALESYGVSCGILKFQAVYSELHY